MDNAGDSRAGEWPVSALCLDRRGPPRSGPAAAIPQKVRARHCCQAPLRRAKDLPVFVSLSTRRPTAPRSWRTSSGFRFLETASPVRKLVRCPRLRPFLGHPLVASCFARRLPEGRVWCRIAQETNTSSGASSRLTPSFARRRPTLPAGGDRFFCPFLLAGFPLVGDWDVRPDHPWNMTRSTESRKQKVDGLACG